MKNLRRRGAEDAESLFLSFLCASAAKAFFHLPSRVNSYDQGEVALFSELKICRDYIYLIGAKSIHTPTADFQRTLRCIYRVAE